MGFFNFILLVIFIYLVYRVFFSPEARQTGSGNGDRRGNIFTNTRQSGPARKSESEQDKIDETIHASDIEDADYKEID